MSSYITFAFLLILTKIKYLMSMSQRNSEQLWSQFFLPIISSRFMINFSKYELIKRTKLIQNVCSIRLLKSCCVSTKAKIMITINISDQKQLFIIVEEGSFFEKIFSSYPYRPICFCFLVFFTSQIYRRNFFLPVFVLQLYETFLKLYFEILLLWLRVYPVFM